MRSWQMDVWAADEGGGKTEIEKSTQGWYCVSLEYYAITSSYHRATVYTEL